MLLCLKLIAALLHPLLNKNSSELSLPLLLLHFKKLFGVVLLQWRSQEFCSGGASHWRRQISNFSYFAQSWFECHWSISGLLQQDMTSNIFYQLASINLNKDKKTFAFAVIIIKQLLTKQFSINIKNSGKRSVV